MNYTLKKIYIYIFLIAMAARALTDELE